MDGVKDLSCLMVNNLTISDSIIDSKVMTEAGGGSFLRQIVMSLVLFVNNKRFTDWTEDGGHLMLRLPWSIFGYFKSIWIHTAKFAADYNNVNVFRTKCHPSNLGIKELKNAAMVANIAMDHFKKQKALCNYHP